MGAEVELIAMNIELSSQWVPGDASCCEETSRRVLDPGSMDAKLAAHTEIAGHWSLRIGLHSSRDPMPRRRVPD